MKKRLEFIISILMITIMLVCTACGNTVSDSTPTESTEVEEKTSEVNPEDLIEKMPETNIEMPTDENEDIIIANASAAYEYYLGISKLSDMKAVVKDGVSLGYGDFDLEHVGEELSFSELKSRMTDGRLMESDDEMTVEFNFVYPFTTSTSPLLALKFSPMNIDGAGDDSYSVLILNYNGEGLDIIYSFSSWSRNTTVLDFEGKIVADGSGGAGLQIHTENQLTPDGKVINIFDRYDISGMDIRFETDEAAYDEVYLPSESFPMMTLSLYTINNNRYYTYSGEVSDEDERFIALCREKGIEWVSEEEVLSIAIDGIKPYYEYFYLGEGVYSIVYNPIAESEDLIVPIESDGAFSASNYQEEIGLWDYEQSKKALFENADMSKITNHDDLMEIQSAGVFDYAMEKPEKAYLLDEYYNTPDWKYSLYLTSYVDSYVVLPDGQYMELDISFCDLIYCETPDVRVYDYDNDGIDELSINSFVFHGTGVYQHSLTMIDVDEYNCWHAYHVSPNYLTEELQKHLLYVDRKTNVTVLFDGKEVESYEKTEENSMRVIADQNLGFSRHGKTFTASMNPIFSLDDDLWSSYMLPVYFTFIYTGNGEWDVTKVSTYEGPSFDDYVTAGFDNSQKDPYVIWTDPTFGYSFLLVADEPEKVYDWETIDFFYTKPASKGSVYMIDDENELLFIGIIEFEDSNRPLVYGDGCIIAYSEDSGTKFIPDKEKQCLMYEKVDDMSEISLASYVAFNN